MSNLSNSLNNLTDELKRHRRRAPVGTDCYDYDPAAPEYDHDDDVYHDDDFCENAVEDNALEDPCDDDFDGDCDSD